MFKVLVHGQIAVTSQCAWVSTVAACILIGGSPSRSAAQPLALAYEADIESTAGNQTTQVHVMYDHGKYNEAIAFPGVPVPPNGRYQLIYDDSLPHIEWSYNTEIHEGRPEVVSIYRQLSEEAKRDGEAAVRKKYGITNTGRKLIESNSANSILGQYCLLSWSAIADLNIRNLVGTETLAGMRCDIYETQYGSATATVEPTASGRSINGGHFTDSVSVEPHSGLVLKQTVRIDYGPNSPMPPARRVFLVRVLKIVNHISPEHFKLPAGVKAIVPKLFEGVHLPPGVHEGHDSGKTALTGMG